MVCDDSRALVAEELSDFPIVTLDGDVQRRTLLAVKEINVDIFLDDKFGHLKVAFVVADHVQWCATEVVDAVKVSAFSLKLFEHLDVALKV